jgi:branched-chain amino acid transport system ATP-binding protein
MKDVLLSVANLSVTLGGVQAVKDFSLDVRDGDSVAMFGPNGAGKTTVVNAITGFAPTSDESKILWLGKPITKAKPYKIARAGLARTFQNASGVSDLTIWENVIVANRRADETVERILELLDLADLRDRKVADCSLATRKLAGVAMALVWSPQMLLLDEPLAGLDPSDRDHVVGALKRVCAEGTTIFIIEHDIERALELATRVVVLKAGVKVSECAPEDYSEDEFLSGEAADLEREAATNAEG